MSGNRSGSGTHPGRWREKNEDSLFCCQELIRDASLIRKWGHLFALADGLGGHAAGEIASGKAVEMLPGFYYFEEGGSENPEERLRWAIERVHAEIRDLSRSSFQYQGMGTTLSVIIIRDGCLYVGHVGDSRIYVISTTDRSIEQLTEDHTVVARALREGSLTPEEAQRENRSTLYQAAVNLIERANGNGGEDNITVIVVEVVDPSSPEIFYLGETQGQNPASTDAHFGVDEAEREGEPKIPTGSDHWWARSWKIGLAFVLLTLFLGLFLYAFYLRNGSQ